jgi:hypothetical protein
MLTPTQIIPSSSILPGSILRVSSLRFPGVKHWGVADWDFDAVGQRAMWHSQKGDVLRLSDYAYFSSGQPAEILWAPETHDQQVWVIERLRSKEGLPWNLATANCEQVVRWAVEGTARSEQLGVGILAAISLGIVLLLASAKGA